MKFSGSFGMQLRVKIVLVFLFSLVMSVVLFLLVAGFLTSSPMTGGYSEKDMNRAADEIIVAFTSLPDSPMAVPEQSMQKYVRKFPRMDFTLISPEIKVLFSTLKNTDLLSSGRLLKVLAEQMSEVTVKNGIHTYLIKRSSKTQKSDLIIAIKNPTGHHSSFVSIREQVDRTLAREINRGGELLGYLLITVADPFYTPIELSTDPERKWMIFRVFILGLGIAILVTSVCATLFTRNISRRFSRLFEGIGRFELGSDDILPEDNGRDELSRLTTAFRRMTEKIRKQHQTERRYEEERRRLVSNISHDLRTPLTTIIGYAESLRNGVYDDEAERSRYIEMIHRKSLYMEKLLQELLEFSQVEAVDFRLERTEVDLVELAREVIIEYLPGMEAGKVLLAVEFPEHPVRLRVDGGQISRVLRNLIDNALKYGENGRYLGAKIVEKPEAVELHVSNRGPGIPEEERGRIFDRFYRMDKGRSREGGAGLGLAIVREIVKKHGGEVSVRSDPMDGTVFTVVLPRN